MDVSCMRSAKLRVPFTGLQRVGGVGPVRRYVNSSRSATMFNNTRCEASAAPEAALSPHPDAVKRRMEAEERRIKAAQEHAKASGVKWWEGPGPSNLTTCNTVLEFQQHLENAADNGHLLVVKFFAPHCAACKTMLPKMKQIADQHADVVFIKVNAGEAGLQQFCAELGVQKVPYFHLYRNGALVANFSANLTTINRVRSEVDAYKK